MGIPTNTTILFDLGDTLFFRDSELSQFEAERIATIIGLPQAKVQEALLSNRLAKVWYAKTQSPFRTLEEEDEFASNFFSSILDELGRADLTPEVLSAYDDWCPYRLLPDSVAALEQLYASHTLGILTNGRPSRRRTLRQLGIDHYFQPEFVFISDELGITKPLAGMYAYCEQVVGGSLALVDDEQPNRLAAIQRGWKAVELSDFFVKTKQATA